MDIGQTSSLCRLCMNNNFSHNDLCELSNSTSLVSKIYNCTSIKITMDSYFLPMKICKSCKKKVSKFYIFKQKCLEVDQKLKNIAEVNKRQMFELSIQEIGHIKSDSLTEDVQHYNDNLNSINHTVADAKIQNGDDFKSDENFEHIAKCSEFNEKLESITHINCNNTTQCEHCGYVFETKTSFDKHSCLHHKNVKSFQCTICYKYFTRSENLMNHSRSHSGLKPFTCEICGLSVTTRHTLIRHMKVHCDEKKYTCPTCGRSFKRSFELYPHIRTHSGIRPYKCKLCNKDYTSHGGLRKHSKSHKKLA